MMDIREIYGRFGMEVVHAVRQQLELNQGSLIPLLKRLSLVTPISPVEQHEALAGFIYQYGITFFLQILSSNSSAEEVERLKMQKLVAGTGARAKPAGGVRGHPAPAPP